MDNITFHLSHKRYDLVFDFLREQSASYVMEKIAKDLLCSFRPLQYTRTTVQVEVTSPEEYCQNMARFLAYVIERYAATKAQPGEVPPCL